MRVNVSLLVYVVFERGQYVFFFIIIIYHIISISTIKEQNELH